MVFLYKNSPLSQFYIPYIKTFWETNAPKKQVWGKANITLEDGTIQEQDVVAAELPTEKMIKYLPHGNYKWYVPIPFHSFFLQS